MEERQEVDEQLIKEVFSIIGEVAAKEKSNYIGIDIAMHKEGMKLRLEYFDHAGLDLIYDIRTECLKRNIWFDSGFIVGENYNEWELDRFSLHRTEENDK